MRDIRFNETYFSHQDYLNVLKFDTEILFHFLSEFEGKYDDPKCTRYIHVHLHQY